MEPSASFTFMDMTLRLGLVAVTAYLAGMGIEALLWRRESRLARVLLRRAGWLKLEHRSDQAAARRQR